ASVDPTGGNRPNGVDQAGNADNDTDSGAQGSKLGTTGNSTKPDPNLIAKLASSSNPDAVIDGGTLGCDSGQHGMVGKVFVLPEGPPALPDLDSMTPVGQIDAVNLDVPTRNFKQGFPAVPNLTSWFAIEFFAVLHVPSDGAYIIGTKSDDG